MKNSSKSRHRIQSRKADLQKKFLSLALATAQELRLDITELLPVYGAVPQSPSQKPDLNPERFVSTKEAAVILGLASHTLENWRVSGRGPVFQRHGRRCLYRIKDLILFSGENTFTSTSQYREGLS